MGSPRDLRRCSIRAHARRPRNHHDRQPLELGIGHLNRIPSSRPELGLARTGTCLSDAARTAVTVLV